MSDPGLNMPTTQRINESWIAGLWEHRVALGVAATASILLIALLVMQPDNKTGSKVQSVHDTTPAHKQQTATPRQKNIGQSRSGTPRYSIPKKSLPRQQTKKVAAPPVVKAITARTPAKPARIKRPAPETAVKIPAAAKPLVLPIAKPQVQAAVGQATKQDMKTTPRIFFVQVGAYREHSSAQQQASTLLQKGWNSTVTTNARGWSVVRIGPISSRSAAEKLRQRLLDKARLKGFIVEG